MKKLLIDTDAHRAFWGGQDLRLTKGEFRLLAKLAHKPGSYFSYRDLYDALRGKPGFHAGDGERGVSQNVRSIVKRIRRRFENIDPSLGRHNVIANYMAFGYGLIRDAVAAPCCPTCGQIVIVTPETVIVAAPAPQPEPQPVPDYQWNVVV